MKRPFAKTWSCLTRLQGHDRRRWLGLAAVAVAAFAAVAVAGALRGAAASSTTRANAQGARFMPIPGGETDDLDALEAQWNDRVTYPTGHFNPAWLRRAAAQAAHVPHGVPHGKPNQTLIDATAGDAQALTATGFTSLGPKPLSMNGCSGCFNYTTTEGRVNTIAVDPTTATNGSIVAYAGSVGGGVWKTTNCCSSATTWSVTTDDPLISATSIDTLAIDPNNHNTIYAGTGDLNYGSFSMGSQGILKSTDGGASWTVLGANVFAPAYTEPAGQFPQYDAVGKVRVDPNNSNKVVAGTKKGLFFSYDGGANWAGPCLTNGFTTQRQDITGLELSNMGGGVTRVLAAVGPRGFATTVQYDLNQNGANGIYKANMPASGCPSFTSIAGNGNGFVYGTTVTGSPYATGAALNAGSGTSYGGLGIGNQLGRIDLGVAPSNPNVIYAQVQSIAANSNGGCGNAPGCQLGVWATTDGGGSWSFLAGSGGGSLRDCVAGAGDYPQNWYDQAVAVDPNNPDRVFISTFDVWFALRLGASFNDTTCGYSYPGSAGPVHVDQHALAFVPGSSSILLLGNDGGIHGTTNANLASAASAPTWFNMDSGLNTIEFYSGDISGNFANAASPQANGGAQDNGSAAVTFSGGPTGPAQWQMGKGGDGFYARIDPLGVRFFQGNNSGHISRCATGCTSPNALWTDITSSTMLADQQSFVLPYEVFKGTPGNAATDCSATTCNHMIAGTVRVWETVNSFSGLSTSWYVNSPANLTKQTLGNRSFINQLAYSPATSSLAVVGTNDGNVQIGRNMGTGSNQSIWTNVTGSNAVLPNRPILDVTFDPNATTAPVAYAAVGGFDANTPSTPGHVFQVTCTTSCASFTWANKTGNLPDVPVDSIIANPNIPQQVFAGTDFGLYYTDDITAATPVWNHFTNGIPNAMIWDLQIDRGATTLSAWTRSRGAYVWPLPVAPPASLAITKVADSASVNSGSQAGFTVTLSNAGTGAANGISVTDALPARTGVNWTLDAANSGAGWSVSGSAPNQSLVYSPTTLGANASTSAHVVSSTTSGSCGNLNNTASFTSGNGGSGQASASVSVICATVSISKVADASSVAAGAQIGFTVSISNSTSGTANALSVTDSLPAGTGISWSVDAANSSAGWSISGSAPNQSLVYSPTSLPGNSSTSVHVISATSGGSCGTTYNNTASFSTSNAGSGQASASVGVQCGAQVAQLTGSGTTCSQFGAGTSTSLAALQYTLRSGSIFKVTPTSFTYWVKVGATAGSNSKVIDQAITSGNFSTLFGLATGSAVYDTNCAKISKASFSQSSTTGTSGTITASWNAPAAGTYYIALKLDASSVQRKPAPSPGSSVHYDFSTQGISGSLAGINLTP